MNKVLDVRIDSGIDRSSILHDPSVTEEVKPAFEAGDSERDNVKVVKTDKRKLKINSLNQ